MKKIAIIMDTWTTVAQDQKDGNDIFIVPLMIFVNKEGKTHEYHDYIDIDRAKILEELDDPNSKLTTSQPILGESLQKLEHVLSQYEKVLIIPIPIKLSGTYNGWENIIKELPEEQQKRVFLKDFSDMGLPNYVSVAEALLKFQNEDDCVEKIILELEQKMKKVFVALVVSDVSRLIKSGRVSILKGFLAKALRKKISIEWDNGFKKVAMSSRIKKNILSSLELADKKIDFIKKGIKNFYVCYVQGSDDTLFKEFFEILKNFLSEKKVKVGKTSVVDVPNTVVSHLGKTVLGLYIETE